MNDPCAFSPSERQARRSADYYARMFPTGGSVLDIGFGQGFFLDAAQRAGLRAIGVDRDPALVESALSRGFEARVGDVRSLKELLSGPVDGIMASHLIEHLLPDDLSRLLNDLGASTRRGAKLVLVTPNLRDWRVVTEWFWMDPTHVRPYPPGAVQQIIDPSTWAWETHGIEPVLLTRHAPAEWLNKLRFGRDYGRPGIWYRLRRV